MSRCCCSSIVPSSIWTCFRIAWIACFMSLAAVLHPRSGQLVSDRMGQIDSWGAHFVALSLFLSRAACLSSSSAVASETVVRDLVWFSIHLSGLSWSGSRTAAEKAIRMLMGSRRCCWWLGGRRRPAT